MSIVFRDSGGNPIQTALDIRISLWNVYKQRSGDINPDGSINTNAKHYGGYQTAFTITPDEEGYFIPKTFGLYHIDFDALPNFPAIGPFNAFMQLEYKNQGAPDTSYQIFDFINDPPWNNVERVLVDELASFYTLEAGPQTNWNTFTLDANDSAPTAIALQFGDTLGEQLKWNIANARFELSDDLYIDGSLTLNGPLDFGLFEMKSARLENLASAPTCDSGSKGRMYYNTGNDTPYYCTGTGWSRF